MFCNPPNTCPKNRPSQADSFWQWRQENVHSADDMERALDTMTASLQNVGYSERSTLSVRLAMEEAIVNAHKHGHERDWSKQLLVRYYVDEAGIVAQVEDQGRGFDPDCVPDPLAPENLDRPSGRGLLLMRSFMNGVCHNAQGNRVCLCKRKPRDGELLSQ
jgi:serine/threonine-protein kinase RsbW